jgi:hypothetical protein
MCVCGCPGAWACECACVSIVVLVQHSTRMRHIVTSFVPSGFTRFFDINDTIFGKELLNVKCVFWFSVQPFSRTFLIVRRI